MPAPCLHAPADDRVEITGGAAVVQQLSALGAVVASTPLLANHELADGMAPNAQLLFQDIGADLRKALSSLDRTLAEGGPRPLGHEVLFQGPVADALTHTGQLTMLRRLAGSPIKAENYAKASITAGTVGVSQAAPRVEFD